MGQMDNDAPDVSTCDELTHVDRPLVRPLGVHPFDLLDHVDPDVPVAGKPGACHALRTRP